MGEEVEGHGYNAASAQGYEQGYDYGARPPASAAFYDRFLKGLAIGAAAAYLLTNDGVQRATIKGAVKMWSVVQGGVEEIKERFKDAEAELRAAGAAQGEGGIITAPGMPAGRGRRQCTPRANGGAPMSIMSCMPGTVTIGCW